MKKLITLFLCVNFALSSFAQENKKEPKVETKPCITINHTVLLPGGPCKSSTNTSVDVTWQVNCPGLSEIKKGVAIKVQFLNKYGDWNGAKTKSTNSEVGEIKMNFSGLRYGTKPKIRYFYYPKGVKAGVDQITKQKLWKEYSFEVLKLCDK